MLVDRFAMFLVPHGAQLDAELFARASTVPLRVRIEAPQGEECGENPQGGIGEMESGADHGMFNARKDVGVRGNQRSRGSSPKCIF